MNRLLLLFTLTFFVLQLSSQNKYFISLDASPTLSYRNYKLTDCSSESAGSIFFDNFENNYDSIESSKFGYQVSLQLGYIFSDKLTIQTGIQFKNIGLKSEMNGPSGVYESDNMILTVNNYDYSFDLYTNIYYIGVPILVKYSIYKKNKFTVNLSLGGTTDVLTSYESPNIREYASSLGKEDYSEYPGVAFNVNAGIQFTYKLKDNLDLYILPQYTRYLTPNVKINLNITEDLYFKINHYYYFGDLKIGLRYKL